MSSVVKPLLQAFDIHKSFGGLKALGGVSLSLEQASITGLIGPNGAGKTTFFNVLTGIYKPDAGHTEFRGQTLPAGLPHLVAAQIGRASCRERVSSPV